MTEKKYPYLEPLYSAEPTVQKIIREVVKLEQDRIHQARPRLNSEIVDLIKRVIS